MEDPHGRDPVQMFENPMNRIISVSKDLIRTHLPHIMYINHFVGDVMVIGLGGSRIQLIAQEIRLPITCMEQWRAYGGPRYARAYPDL